MGSTEDEIDFTYELCLQFVDGCQRVWYSDELEQQEIELDAFWIMQTEVTNAAI